MRESHGPVRLLLPVFCLFLASSQQFSQPDPVGDFFKRLGHSIAHPGDHSTPKKPHSEKARGTANASPQPSATPSPSPAPQTEIVRRAMIVTDKTDPRRDLPYGIPVANRPGFVTSPYAPTQGVVDVRGIQGGTQVKDPFTGKIFLRP